MIERYSRKAMRDIWTEQSKFQAWLEVEEMIDAIEDSLYALGESEISSKQVGDKVLDELASRNEVAYVRFASVYKDFKTLDDFLKILEERRELKRAQG